MKNWTIVGMTNICITKNNNLISTKLLDFNGIWVFSWKNKEQRK